MFVLIDVHRHPYAINQYSGIDINLTTFNHMAFEIAPDAFKTEKHRLENLGLELEIHQFRNINARALFFKDPEGNLIEFICHQKAGS